MSTMTVMMTKLGMSPVNPDTAAAKSSIKTNGLLRRSIKAASGRFGSAVSIRLGPTTLRIAAASNAPSGRRRSNAAVEEGRGAEGRPGPMSRHRLLGCALDRGYMGRDGERLVHFT
jgi:hypothetical protein